MPTPMAFSKATKSNPLSPTSRNKEEIVAGDGDQALALAHLRKAEGDLGAQKILRSAPRLALVNLCLPATPNTC